MDTIDLRNLARDCGAKPSRHKGGHAKRLPMTGVINILCSRPLQHDMLDRERFAQIELFIARSLDELVPADQLLEWADPFFDFDSLHREMAVWNCVDNGRPSLNPLVAVRLMLVDLLVVALH